MTDAGSPHRASPVSGPSATTVPAASRTRTVAAAGAGAPATLLVLLLSVSATDRPAHAAVAPDGNVGPTMMITDAVSRP